MTPAPETGGDPREILERHPETFLRLDAVGSVIPPYRPTYRWSGEYIDEHHRAVGTTDLDDYALVVRRTGRILGWPIGGWLRREDALKLYELAFFATGDILELGSYHGLSTSILSEAARQGRGRGRKRIDSVDLSPRSVAMTRVNLFRQGLLRGVKVHEGDATAFVRARRAEGRQYAFAFIDHSHAYHPVHEVCRELFAIMAPGGFCLFHDWNDPRNYDVADADHAVHQAVVNGLDPCHFEFYGAYGVTALYRRS